MLLVVLMKMYRAVIVGFGGMGFHHIDLMKEAKQLQCYGVYDIDPSKYEKNRVKNLKIYPSYEAVLQDQEVDLVVIATPNDIHKDLCIQALEAHKHVVCEKPVTLNANEMKAIMEVANRVGMVFMVHQNRRWDEDYIMIKNLLEKQTLGDVFNIESRVHGANGVPGDWRKEKRYGGGMMLDWGVHLIDQILDCVHATIISIYCDLSFRLGNDCDDGFQLILTFDNSMKARIEVGTTNFIKMPRWYVQGANGTAMINEWGSTGDITIRNDMVSEVVLKPVKAGAGFTKTMAPPSEDFTTKVKMDNPKDEKLPFYANVVATIEGGTAYIKNEQVLRVMDIMDHAIQASEKNQVIKYNDLYFNQHE